MSNNKYIIDEDSLVEIADAVRDKLGTGQATTDPQTGDIIYPEDKGYYLKEDLIAKFNIGDRQINGGHYSAGSATYLTLGSASDSTDYNLYFQKPFYSATLSFTHSGTTSRYHTLSVNGVSSTNIVGNTAKQITFSTPQSYLTISSYMESAYGTDTAIYQNLTVTLFDQNGNNIKVKTTSIQSYNFLTGIVPEKIPFSIEDIQNKIASLSAGGDAPKIAFLSNFLVKGQRSSDGTDLTPYGGLSNIYLIVGIYNYNYLGYLDMVNHPDKVGTYSGYDTYRFYYLNGGTETTLVDAQYYTYNGANYFYNMGSYYGTELSPCFIVYKEA